MTFEFTILDVATTPFTVLVRVLVAEPRVLVVAIHWKAAPFHDRYSPAAQVGAFMAMSLALTEIPFPAPMSRVIAPGPRGSVPTRVTPQGLG